VLRDLGDDAKLRLLEAIDSETDLRKQAYLISALQAGFNDFSRFHLWLDYASSGRVSVWSMNHMGTDVQNHFESAPDLVKDGRICPEFLKWWHASAATGKPFATQEVTNSYIP
jgi:hypothetical protein